MVPGRVIGVSFWLGAGWLAPGLRGVSFFIGAVGLEIDGGVESLVSLVSLEVIPSPVGIEGIKGDAPFPVGVEGLTGDAPFPVDGIDGATGEAPFPLDGAEGTTGNVPLETTPVESLSGIGLEELLRIPFHDILI